MTKATKARQISSDNGTWRNRIIGHGEEAPDKLLANPRNWRTHPKAQREALAGVLDEVGWVQDVIVNRRTGLMVDGHLRVELAVERGEANVPVKYVDLDEGEETLILATLDPLAGMAGTATDALEALLATATPAGAAVKGLLEDVAKGAGLNGAKEGLTDPDAVPEMGEPVAKRGDVWVCGEHRVMCGDSTDAEDVARLMAGERAIMVFADPPYSTERLMGKPGGYPGRSGHFDGLVGDNLSAEEHATLLTCLAPFEEKYVCCDWRSYPEVVGVLEQPKALIVWVKNQGMGRIFRHRHEFIAYWGGFHSTKETDVWEHNTEHHASYQHPTQKASALPERAITNSSQPGDLILDPFLGSGTTMIAAERLGRRCYGMEIEPRYVDVAVRRWEDFTGRKAELSQK